MLKRIALVAVASVLAVRLAYSACETILATDATRVLKAGDTMTGALNMTNVNITLTGASGYVTSAASMTASAFFGDGANLTALNATQLTSGTLPMARIATGDIDTTKLITGACDTNRLTDWAVSSIKILSDAVTTAKIAANAVDTTKLGSGAVGQSQLAASAVNTNNIAAAAVDTTKILAGSVDTNRLATDAVTTAKILYGAVDTSKILLGAVDTNRIGKWAIDTGKINVTGAGSGQVIKVVSGQAMWADDSTAAGSQVLYSTYTFMAQNQDVTQTTLGPCISGSTIAIANAASGDYEASVDAATLATVGTPTFGCSVLVDGQFQNGESGAAGGPMQTLTSASIGVAIPPSTTLPGLSAATHNFCLTCKVDAGTGRLCYNPASATKVCRFSVKRVL